MPSIAYGANTQDPYPVPVPVPVLSGGGLTDRARGGRSDRRIVPSAEAPAELSSPAIAPAMEDCGPPQSGIAGSPREDSEKARAVRPPRPRSHQAPRPRSPQAVCNTVLAELARATFLAGLKRLNRNKLLDLDAPGLRHLKNSATWGRFVDQLCATDIYTYVDKGVGGPDFIGDTSAITLSAPDSPTPASSLSKMERSPTSARTGRRSTPPPASRTFSLHDPRARSAGGGAGDFRQLRRTVVASHPPHVGASRRREDPGSVRARKRRQREEPRRARFAEVHHRVKRRPVRVMHDHSGRLGVVSVAIIDEVHRSQVSDAARPCCHHAHPRPPRLATSHPRREVEPRHRR